MSSRVSINLLYTLHFMKFDWILTSKPSFFFHEMITTAALYNKFFNLLFQIGTLKEFNDDKTSNF